jgi:ABC-type sugar transport system ATPase subunit
MCEVLGEDFFVDLTVGERLVRAKMNGGERPAERSQVRIALDPLALHVFDRQTGARL